MKSRAWRNFCVLVQQSCRAFFFVFWFELLSSQAIPATSGGSRVQLVSVPSRFQQASQKFAFLCVFLFFSQSKTIFEYQEERETPYSFFLYYILSYSSS